MVFQNSSFIISKKTKIVGIHLCVWLLFICYEISYLYLLGTKLSSFLKYLLPYLINASLFYSNAWCLTYAFTKKKKPYLFIILLILELLGYGVLHFTSSEMLSNWSRPIAEYEDGSYIVLITYRAIYFIGLSTGYWFALLLLTSNNLINKMQSRHLIQQARSAELEKNLFKAKNAYLTSQINPHLLFNTLNFIYSTLYEVSEEAAETVMLLSDMMRYSLTEVGEDGKVELWQEVEHIENMIKLNQARFNNELQIKLFLNGEFQVKIIPLVLLTFIENIFKHGDLSDASHPAQVNISYFHDTLEFYSTNKVRAKNINRGTGIGIENSKTRLDIAYPDCYKLVLKAEGDQYISHLTIKFKQPSLAPF